MLVGRLTVASALVALLAAAACTGGAGPEGPPGPPGPAGSACGPPGPADTILTSDGVGGTAWKSTANLTGLNVSGRIGIGTTSPQFDLHVLESSNVGFTVERYGGTAGIGFRQADGTQVAPSASTSALGQLRYIGYGTTGFTPSKVAIEIAAAEPWSDVAQGAMLHFYTTPLGATTPQVRVRISAGGHIAEYSESPVLSACGVGAALDNGADSNGVVTEGAGATGCVLTFATPYLTPPACSLSSRVGLAFTYTISTTAITITNVGALAGTAIDYICHGW